MLTEAGVRQAWPESCLWWPRDSHARGWDKGAGQNCHRVPLAGHVPPEPPCPQPPEHQAGAGWTSVHSYGPALFPQRFQ